MGPGLQYKQLTVSLPTNKPNNKGSPHPHKQTGWLMDWLNRSDGALHVRAQQELRFYLWPQFIDWCCIHLHTRNHKLSLNMIQKSIQWSSQSNQAPLIMRGVGLNGGFITHRNWRVQLEWMRRRGRQWLTFVIANQWKDDDSEMHTGVSMTFRVHVFMYTNSDFLHIYPGFLLLGATMKL